MDVTTLSRFRFFFFLASYFAFHFFQWICSWVWAVLPAAQTVHWEAPATAWPLAPWRHNAVTSKPT